MTTGGTVRVELGARGYDVIVGAGNLHLAADVVHQRNPEARVAVVSDDNVAPLYGSKVLQAVEKQGHEAGLIVIPAGEEAKNVNTLALLWNGFVDLGLDRGGLVVALGGGVVGDVTGFAAGTFLRGVDYIQVPTTLLAQVDSSVGGKTAVNLPAGKNLAGIFHQPSGVLVDVLTLKTLPERELRAGLSEVIKYGVIWDEDFIGYLEENGERLLALEPDVLAEVVMRSAAMKAAVVAADETETGLRRILNYGHTFAHALENITGYGVYLHGEAVAWGMVVAARLAAEMGMLKHSDVDRLVALIERLSGVPSPSGLNASKILESALRDKKTLAGRIHYVLPDRLGRVVVRDDVDEELVLKVVEGHISRG